MITLRILLSPGRRGRIVDASGRSVPQPLPAPVIGSAEPLRIILLDPATLDPADPYGFDTGAPLRLTISGDWDPATIPVYATNALVRSGVGTYDLADPSGTRTAEALALLGVLAERLCAWELTAYGGDPATEADWAHPLSVVQFDAPLRQRADSLGGDPAEAPAVDLRGPAGQQGPAGPGPFAYVATPTITPDPTMPGMIYAPYYRNAVVDLDVSGTVETVVPAYHPTADDTGYFCLYRIANNTDHAVGVTTSVGGLVTILVAGEADAILFYCVDANRVLPLVRSRTVN